MTTLSAKVGDLDVAGEIHDEFEGMVGPFLRSALPGNGASPRDAGVSATD